MARSASLVKLGADMMDRSFVAKKSMKGRWILLQFPAFLAGNIIAGYNMIKFTATCIKEDEKWKGNFQHCLCHESTAAKNWSNFARSMYSIAVMFSLVAILFFSGFL